MTVLCKSDTRCDRKLLNVEKEDVASVVESCIKHPWKSHFNVIVNGISQLFPWVYRTGSLAIAGNHLLVGLLICSLVSLHISETAFDFFQFFL